MFWCQNEAWTFLFLKTWKHLGFRSISDISQSNFLRSAFDFFNVLETSNFERHVVVFRWPMKSLHFWIWPYDSPPYCNFLVSISQNADGEGSFDRSLKTVIGFEILEVILREFEYVALLFWNLWLFFWNWWLLIGNWWFFWMVFFLDGNFFGW